MGGLLIGLLVGGILVVFGVVQFDWTASFQRRLRMARAFAKPTRMVILGDSFLTWWPVEHCLKVDLEKFGEQHGIGVINTAHGGFGPHEYLDQMRQIAPQLQPGDVVLQFYYVGNDLTDVQYRADDTPRRPEGTAPAVTVEKGPRQTRVIRRRRARAFARAVLSRNAPGFVSLVSSTPPPANPGPERGSTNEEETPFPEHPEFDWNVMLEHGIDRELIEFAINRLQVRNQVGPRLVNPYLLDTAMARPRYLLDNVLMETEENRAAWVKAEAALQGVVDLARQRQAKLVLIAIPSTAQVDRSHYAFFRKATFEIDDRLFNSTAPQDLLREFSDRNGIVFFDLLPVLRRHPESERLYWDNDDHLSSLGHQVAFEAIHDAFLKHWVEDK